MQVQAMVLNIFRVTETGTAGHAGTQMGPDYQRRFGIRGAAYRRDRYIEYAARRDSTDSCRMDRSDFSHRAPTPL
jgi:hypothetical protein